MAQKLYSSMLYPVFTDGNPYLCDANGNETRNLSHRVKEASYNTMDLPTLVTFTDGNSLRMRYTSDGRRVETLSKTWLTPLVVPADTLALRDSTLQYAQEAPSAFLAASTSSTASTSSSNSGITSDRPATGITGPALYLPYRLHREWRIGDVVLEDSLISRIDIRNGSFRVERDSLGGASLACYRHVTDYLGSVRTVYRMGTSWVLTPVQHITYMPSGAVLANSDGDVQQRMFCGKELQPLHGWKMYDSHARMQYNVLPRFSSTDPLCQKYYHLSPYAYCANDPVNLLDENGLDYNDIFGSLDDAALDFGRIYNYFSIQAVPGYPYGREYTTLFYSFQDSEGNTRYSYTKPLAQKGSSAKVALTKKEIPRARRDGSVRLAYGHTHGADDTRSISPHGGNKFSLDDLYADKSSHHKIPSFIADYLATPNGSFMKHWYNTEKDQWEIITFKGDKYQLPSDENDITHGKYTIKFIREKYDNLKLSERLFLSMTKYLEERCYK